MENEQERSVKSRKHGLRFPVCSMADSNSAECLSIVNGVDRGNIRGDLGEKEEREHMTQRNRCKFI